MKKLYSFKSGILSRLVIGLGLVVMFNLSVFGHVTIMPGSATIDACNNFPASGTVTNIVLSETAAADLTDGTHTIILEAPANYIFTVLPPI